ncbi:MAG: 2-succinyl-5-enolpyruvyl-6-hydroxy-3-cyclohexene-1-carboxylic-acid synthase [Balneola sp.]|nr:MAG: 2-succinyl-5-enolpyruvyl-6-hydroxy-3-cyclohexene-1-carboxylic-acid synthase [Balneola sp.]
MPDRDPINLNFYWSTQFVRSLYEEGVREVVISPGSRSTPLTLAFAAHPGFQKHVVIDERSAAFIALGIGKASGKPACLVCTSGTALANYYPTVIEATLSKNPMIVLSADRPPHLREIGASQTIDQLKAFGDYPVFFHDIGEPKKSNKSIIRLQKAASQAVMLSKSKSGVAHLNFPFSKPLTPEEEFFNTTIAENEKHARQSYRSYKATGVISHLDEQFWSDLVSSERPVLIAGATSTFNEIETIQNLAKTLDAPIIAEPGSKVPSSKYVISGYDGFLRNGSIAEELSSDLILRFGSEPVSKALINYLSRHSETPQIRFLRDDFLEDESLTSTKHICLQGTLDIPEVSGATDKHWLRNWRRYQKSFAQFRQNSIHPSTPLTDGYIFHTLSQLLPKKAFVMLSNSFPVRDFSLFTNNEAKDVFVNRGAAGIDGIISTSLGISKSAKKTGVLFIGDIAFLHDSNALLEARHINRPLVIIVLNNAGGSIFRILPIHDLKETFTPFFETPQQVSIAALCRAHKVDHALISKPEQLITAFEERIEKPGIHVLECITDAEESMVQRELLWNNFAEEK